MPCSVQLRAVPIYGKMAGAVGNYNAHISAYPDVQWDAVADEFVSGLGLQLNLYVTQVWLITHTCILLHFMATQGAMHSITSLSHF